jgi:hypothetical protein
VRLKVGLHTRLAGRRVRRKDHKKQEQTSHQVHNPSHADPDECHAKIIFLPFSFLRGGGEDYLSDVGAFIEHLIRTVCVICVQHCTGTTISISISISIPISISISIFTIA